MKATFLLFAYFFIVLVSGTPVLAQAGSSGVGAVATLLRKELQKANIRVPDIHVSSSLGKPGFQLQLLDKKDAAKFRLADAPADAFYIKGNKQSVYIGSTTATGLRNGVYWYLYQLGYRYYFPELSWHHTPSISSLYKDMEGLIAPSYTHRRIWYAYGTGSKKADADYNKWFEANLLGGEEVSAGHSYDALVNRNKNVFLQHPEYFAQKVAKGSIPPDPKFEVSNEELVQLCIRDAIQQVKTAISKTGAPPAMISMDPSDGGGFSTSPASLKIGGPSEQAFYLANRVAKALREQYPSVKVGLYAYNQHAAPPKFDLEPNVVVLIATALNQSAFRTDELIALWKNKKVTLGIRDYYGVMAWDWDMPGQPNGAKIGYVSQLKTYHTKGIRLFTAETNIGWISRGLGHYIAARLLWDVDQKPETIKKEFFRTMFGKAAQPVEELFNKWQQYGQPVPLEGDVYDWYTLLQKAERAEKNKAVQERILQIKQYLHYVYLFMQWRANENDENLVAMFNYAYRVQDKGIVASYPLFRRLGNSAVAGKANMRFDDPNAVWKRHNAPVTAEETQSQFKKVLGGLNKNQKGVQVALPAQLSTAIPAKSTTATAAAVALRGVHAVLFQISERSNAALQIYNGLIKASQYKTLRLTVYPYTGSLPAANAKAVLQESITAKKPEQSIDLSSLKPGSYIAMIDDARNGFTLRFSGSVAYGILAGSGNKMWTFGRNNLYFRVAGVDEFKINNEGVMTLRSPKGRIIDLQQKKGLTAVKVQKGEEGVWALQRQSGVFQIEGIVPLVAGAQEFLLNYGD